MNSPEKKAQGKGHKAKGTGHRAQGKTNARMSRVNILEHETVLNSEPGTRARGNVVPSIKHQATTTMKDYIIRDYRKEDYPQVLSIWESTGMAEKEREDDEHVIERSLKMGGKFLILEKKSGGEIIGTCWMTYNGRRIYLHHFVIKPEFQGKGLGYYLGLASIKFAQEKKCQVKLEVLKSNLAAVKLYRKLGFDYLGDCHVLIMRDPCT